MIFSRSVAGGAAVGERDDRADDLRAGLRAMSILSSSVLRIHDNPTMAVAAVAAWMIDSM
jgi:hypothetical protein